MYTATFDKNFFTHYFIEASDEVLELINEYLKSHADIINSLTTSFEKDTKDFCNTLHFHSAVFMCVGFPQLTLDFLDFERKCKNNDRINMKEQFISLLNCVKATKTILCNEILKSTTISN